MIGGVAVDGGGALVVNGVLRIPWILGVRLVDFPRSGVLGRRSEPRGYRRARVGGEASQITAREPLQFIRAAIPDIEKETQGGE